MSYGSARSRSETQAMRVLPRRAAGIGTEAIAAEGITFPVFVGLVHFVLVQLVASLAWRFGTIREDSAPFTWTPPELGGWAATLVEPLRLWDGLWYKLIAEEGYRPHLTSYPAFWPLFPWLMRAGNNLTGAPVETVGWVIANLSFFGALIVLYRLISLDFDRPTARRALVALAFFPTAFFFSAVYSESLFLLLAAGALLAARQGNWLVAGLVGALAALTRSQGVLLLLPFAVLFVQQHWPVVSTPRRWLLPAVFAALPILGPIVFGLHLDRLNADEVNRRANPDPAFEATNPIPWTLDQIGLHDPAFVYVQWQWWRFGTDPWTTLRCGSVGCVLDVNLNGDLRENQPIRGADLGWIGDLARSPSWSTVTSFEWRDRVARGDWLELLSTLLFFALALVGLRRLPLYYSAFLWPPLVVPLFAPSIIHPLYSIPRFGLVLFPLFVVVALLVRDRRIGLPLLAGSTLLLVLFTIQFAQWYWVS